MDNFSWVSAELDFSLKKKDSCALIELSECTESSVFDLASLTKVIVTATLYYDLYLKSDMNEDAFWGQDLLSFLPELKNTPLENVSLENFINHQSGLVAHDLISDSGRTVYSKSRQDLHRYLLRKICCNKDYFHKDLQKKETCYSDLGFLILLVHLERASEKNISCQWEQFKSENNLSDLFLNYRPNFPADFELKNVLKSESRHDHAVVNDDNTFFMNGLSTHAGLFGDAQSLIKYIEFFRFWILSNEPLKRLWEKSNNGRFFYGWDTPSGKQNSQLGFPVTSKARGHLGYTGCALFIDLSLDKAGFLLSNRICPNDSDESKEKIKLMRTQFFSKILSDDDE